MIELGTNTAHIRRVDRPQEEPILVALQRLRHCADEIPEEYWPPGKRQKSRHATSRSLAETVPGDDSGGMVSGDERVCGVPEGLSPNHLLGS